MTNKNERKVFGRTLIGRLSYLENTKGRRGLDAIFKRMIEKGYKGPSHMGDIGEDKKYPLDYHLLLLESFEELYGKREFENMSRHAPMAKGVINWYVKFFKKPDVLIGKVDEYWSRFYDFGQIQGKVLDPKSGILTGKDVCVSTPLFCRSLTGYFVGVCNVIDLHASCKHTRCEMNGDNISEWKLYW